MGVDSQQRILLIGINYEPERTGIGPYNSALASHLALKGHDVHVITGMPHYPQWKIEPEYRRYIRVREDSGGVAVRRLRHYTPSKQSAARRALYEITFFLHASSVLRLPELNCVVGVVPSLGGGAAAAVMSRRYGIPFGLIVQDLIGQAALQSGIPGGRLAARPAEAVEASVARRAARIAIVADAFRSHLRALGVPDEKIVHLPNWSRVGVPLTGRNEVRRRLGWGYPVALHAGNMGYKQGLENVVAAARLASGRGSNVRFVLMGDGSDRKRVEKLAADEPNVLFLDPAPENTFMDILGAADVLVLNERNTVLSMSMPSKITSYFRAGRPVVAAVPPGGATSEELRRSGGALVVNSGDPEALLTAIERALSDRSLSDAIVRAASAYARQHLDQSKLLDRAEEFVRSVATSAGQ